MPDRFPLPPDPGRCAELCQSCHHLCLETMMYCLGRGGDFADADRIRLLVDSAQAAALAADFLIRESPLAGPVCAVCAEACDLCATACETFADERRLTDCAYVCRQCGALCRALAGA